MSHPDDLIAVLDANVLYPQWLRDVMLTLAAMGYYEPRATDDRHVLATAIAAEAHLVVTANTNDFESPRYVTAGHVAIETPTDFLITVLDAHPDLMATVLLHLATRRRGVATIADVLDQLARNHALQPFADLARDRLQ